MVRFDDNLIEYLMIEEVGSVEDLMDNIPIFCLNYKVKKILWEAANCKNDIQILKQPSSKQNLSTFN